MPKNEQDDKKPGFLKKAKETLSSLRYGNELPDIKDTLAGVSIGSRGNRRYVSINYFLTGIVDFLKPGADEQAVKFEGSIIFELLKDDGRASQIPGHLSCETAEVLSQFREKYCDIPKRRE